MCIQSWGYASMILCVDIFSLTGSTCLLVLSSGCAWISGVFMFAFDCSFLTLNAYCLEVIFLFNFLTCFILIFGCSLSTSNLFGWSCFILWLLAFSFQTSRGSTFDWISHAADRRQSKWIIYELLITVLRPVQWF